MAEINAEERALSVIYKDLSVLQAENRVHLKGQPVVAKNDAGKIGIKFGDWDWENDDISAGTAFNDLDWLVAPEAAGGNGGFTPFKIRTTDEQYEIIGDDLIITDTRLVLAEDPCVYVSKWAAFLRDADMVVDAIAGTVTIPGFGGMEATEHVEIMVPSRISTADSFEALLPRITALELYTKPFAMGGAIYVWKKAAILIPEQFQEVTEFRGKTIVGQFTEDEDFDTIGKTGGNKSHTVDPELNLKKFRLFTVVNQTLSSGDNPYTIGRIVSAVRTLIKQYDKTSGGGKESFILAGADADNVEPTLSPTSSIGKDTPDAIPHLDPYRVVMFIELKEEYQTT